VHAHVDEEGCVRVLMGDRRSVNTVLQAAESYHDGHSPTVIQNAMIISNESALMADLTESLGHRELSAVVLLVATHLQNYP
jgi:hypothetical protein